MGAGVGRRGVGVDNFTALCNQDVRKSIHWTTLQGRSDVNDDGVRFCSAGQLTARNSVYGCWKFCLFSFLIIWIQGRNSVGCEWKGYFYVLWYSILSLSFLFLTWLHVWFYTINYSIGVSIFFLLLEIRDLMQPLVAPKRPMRKFCSGLCYENTNDYNANYHYIILPQCYKEKKNNFVIITQWQKVTMTMIRDQLQRSNNKIWLSIKVIIRETPTITIVVSMRRNLTSVLTM